MPTYIDEEMGYQLGPQALDSILEEYRIQPNITWMKVRLNDLPPNHHHLILVLFNDGTVASNFPENIDWLGAVAYAHVGF